MAIPITGRSGVTPRRALLVPVLVGVLLARGLRVRYSVKPRRQYWRRRRTGPGPLVVALGDSLTQGTGSTRGATSWLGLFVSDLAARWGTSIRIDNRAVYGARIADLIRVQLPVPVDAALVTMCIGSNDAGRTPPAEFRAAVRQVCALLPPGSIVGDVPEFQWGPRIAAAAVLSAIVREEVAAQPRLMLAEVERHTRGIRILTEFAGDFFHPNNSGHRRIAAAFIEAGRREPSAEAVPEVRRQGAAAHWPSAAPADAEGSTTGSSRCGRGPRQRSEIRATRGSRRQCQLLPDTLREPHSTS
jgi:acyl-CoA thioesterase I